MPYTKTINGEEYNVLRHTPRDKQRLFLYSPLIVESEAMVLPEIFNDQYLKIENYEPVDYWQNFNDGAAVSVTPAVPGTGANEGTQVVGDPVSIPYVVGCLFDADAILVNNYLEDSLATPVEARKRFYNIWWTFARNAINDYSENFILFTMEDEGGAGTLTLDKNALSIEAEGTGTVTIVSVPEGTANVECNYSTGITDVTVSDDTITITAGDTAQSDIVTVCAFDSDNNIIATSVIVVTITAG